MENLILVLVFIGCLCGVFCVADLCVTLIAKRNQSKQSKLNGFNYKL